MWLVGGTTVEEVILGSDNFHGIAPTQPAFGDFDNLSLCSGVKGDANGDGVLTNGDIAPFVLALTNPAQYAIDFPGVNPANLDVNCDGVFNNLDISAFLAALTGRSSLIGVGKSLIGGGKSLRGGGKSLARGGKSLRGVGKSLTVGRESLTAGGK